MSTSAQKALAACREYDRLMTAIKSESQIIASSPCTRPELESGKSHLGDVLDGYEDENRFGGVSKFHYTHDESMEIIGDCKGCMQAYEAIQRRKAAKKQLGAVKRSIRFIAKQGAT